MGNYSEPHICQCLSRLSTIRRNSPVTISGDRRKTGPEFSEAVLGLAQGLRSLGLNSGDVVAVAALNRSFPWNSAKPFVFFFFFFFEKWFLETVMWLYMFFSEFYLEWLLAIAFVGGLIAPLNYRWVSAFSFNFMQFMNNNCMSICIHVRVL